MLTRRNFSKITLAAIPVSAIPKSFAASRKTTFGVNCFDLFYRPFLQGLAKSDPRKRLEPLAKVGLPLVRFAASPFWPNEWKKVIASYQNTFVIMNKIMSSLAELNMQGVPSLVWYPPGLSDAVGERASAWGSLTSKASAEANRYIRSMISQYPARKEVLFWEFGNEFDSFASFPTSTGAEKYYPKVNVAQGTFPERTVADRFSVDDIRGVYARFANIAHELDPTKRLSSGSAGPRKNLIHSINSQPGNDTEEEFRKAIGLFMPPMINVVSLHLYTDYKARLRPQGTNYLEVLQSARQVADQYSALLFVGEFGVASDETNARTEFAAMLKAIIESGVDYAAVWAYDFPNEAKWDVSPTSASSWQLDALAEANR